MTKKLNAFIYYSSWFRRLAGQPGGSYTFDAMARTTETSNWVVVGPCVPPAGNSAQPVSQGLCSPPHGSLLEAGLASHSVVAGTWESLPGGTHGDQPCETVLSRPPGASRLLTSHRRSSHGPTQCCVAGADSEDTSNWRCCSLVHWRPPRQQSACLRRGWHMLNEGL